MVEAARYSQATILKQLLGYVSDDDLQIVLQGGLWWTALRNHLEPAQIMCLFRFWGSWWPTVVIQ